MLNITNRQENMSQIHNKMSPHTSRNGYYKKDKKQVLVRMWRKGNLGALLVGMQTGTATVEISMEVPQKIENRVTR